MGAEAEGAGDRGRNAIANGQAPLQRLKRAIKNLKNRTKEPVPELEAAPFGVSSDARISFVEAAFKWMGRTCAAYGWRENYEDNFGENSLLSVVMDQMNDKPANGDIKFPQLPLSDLIGEPPNELYSPTQSNSSVSAGLSPLSRTELRGWLDSLTQMWNRNGEEPPALQDGELRYIALNADQPKTPCPEQWRKLYSNLRRRMTDARRLAFSLAAWAEGAVALAVGKFNVAPRLAWVGKAKKLIEEAYVENRRISLAELAEKVGKAESTVLRQFRPYFKRGGHPQGVVGRAVYDGDSAAVDATTDELPARPRGGRHHRE